MTDMSPEELRTAAQDAYKAGHAGPARAERVEHLVQDLKSFWIDTATADIERVAPKAVEYGAADLLVIGAGIAPWLDDAGRIEAGIAFYQLGKASRIAGAYAEGRIPSDDSLEDSRIYSYMASYVRKHGRWP